MSKPRISYVDPAKVEDAAMRAEFDRCAREGTPRPESQAVRAHVPAVFWSFANSWRDVFKNGVAEHGIKELCRIYVSRSVLCEFCGNQRSVKAAKQGMIEDDYRDLINFESSSRYDERQKAALSYAEAITWDLPVDDKFWAAAQAFQRARAGRDRLFRRADHGAATLAAHARHRASPDSRRHRRVDGAGIRDRGRAQALEAGLRLLGEDAHQDPGRGVTGRGRLRSISCPGRSAVRAISAFTRVFDATMASGALQIRDRYDPMRSRISGAPLRNSFALHRIRDTIQHTQASHPREAARE
jgi:alkylhydroperoxidase family enzyme